MVNLIQKINDDKPSLSYAPYSPFHSMENITFSPRQLCSNFKCFLLFVYLNLFSLIIFSSISVSVFKFPFRFHFANIFQLGNLKLIPTNFARNCMILFSIIDSIEFHSLFCVIFLFVLNFTLCVPSLTSTKPPFNKWYCIQLL